MRYSVENSQWEQDETTEMDSKLKDLDNQIKQMEKENREFFEELGLSLHQIEDILSDKKKYSKASYEYIQRQRYRLENALEERIALVNSDLKREKASLQPPIKGHWVLIR